MRKSKFLSILLALCLTLSLLPVSALADGAKGTAANPYSREEFAAMTRDGYIAAQNALGGTMYVNVGDYSYDTNGTLGNGVRDDTTGQTENRNVLNGYNSNGYLGAGNDGANGKNVVFVNGSITSGVTGYTSIDNIGTSLLLAVPAYTNVTFEGITFNGVMSFNYQLYTGPWSQLGELKFDGCTFNGIIVGATAAQTLTFNRCTFTDYTNTTDANSSNPTWIRPAYGNWSKGDNEGQGGDFRSLTEINFTNNTVTSTRPVKFEYISQWDITSTVTATGNSFDISAQPTDRKDEIKNVGLYLGAHTSENAFNLVAENNTRSANTAALYTIPKGTTSLPTGSTVKDSQGNEITLTDVLKWKGNPDDVLTLKTECKAKIGNTYYDTLTAAIQAASNGDTIVLMPGVTVTLDNGIANEGANARTVTIQGDGTQTVDVITNAISAEGGMLNYQRSSNFTFDNVTVQAGEGNFDGIVCNELTLNRCTVKGKLTLYGKATFTGCTFENTMDNQYSIWTWGGTDVKVENCTFNTNGKAILLYGQATAENPTNLTVSNTEFNDRKDGAAGKAAIEIGNDYNATYNLAVTNAAVNGFAEGKNTGSKLWANKNSMSEDDLTVSKDGEVVYGNGLATVGSKVYTSLDAAFAALNAENHTLALSTAGEAKWAPATPVYWKAGTQSGYAAKLTEALTAAYMANAGDITIVCRPNADVGTMTHGHVADDLTIYGNNAYISGGECDLEVDTFKFSRATGKQATDGVTLDKNITITGYELDNLGVWGQRTTGYTVNVNLIDCDGKVLEGKTNVQRVYISGTSGVNNITVTDCDFITNNTSVYSNADGVVMIDSCSFTGSKVPVNFNHKANGTQTVTVKNSSFTGCGDNGEWKQFAAPVRFVNSGTGTMSANVSDCTITDTKGDNGDILLGDGRKGESSNDVTLTVSGTNGTVVAQRPGYYNGDATVSGKRADAAVKSSDSPLVTTLNKMLPVKNEIDLDEFLAMVKSAGYNFDGAAVTGDGSKLVVKWSPVNGCFDTREGHKCTVNNVAATGNTPKRVNNGLTQFQLYKGESYNVTVKNVSFVYEPAAFTVCENSRWAGSFTAEQAPAGQLYYMTTGDVTFESCDFDKVVLTTFNTTGTSTVKNCTLANVYNNYAIKDIRGEHIIVTGNTITNCGGGVMVSSTDTVSDVNISGNTFTNVDVAGTAPADKVGKRALIQIASSGNYTDTELILDGNTASNCGPILRQLNQGIADNDVLSKNLKGDLTGLGGKLTFTGDSVKKASEGEPSQPTIYTVKFSGSDVADKKVVSGTTIDLPTAAKSGYTFNGWYDGSTKVSSPYKVTKDVTLTASWSYNYSGGSSSYDPTYSVSTPSKTENGSVTVSPKNASKGANVTVTVKPNEGYELGSLAVKDANGNLLPLADLGNGKFSFVMPASKVSVEAEFVKTASTSFADVPANAYFADAVKWAVNKGITNGLSDTMFGPYESCTRAQIVTFLWRAAGSPELKTASSFTDVPANAYYAKAVAWAVENGITNGMTETTFAPDAACTRGQSVTFLYRALKGTASGSTNFTDVKSDTFYADAINWAVANNVTNGTSNTMFSPNADCTRAEIVTFLYRAYQGK